jgi:predicted secreted protein
MAELRKELQMAQMLLILNLMEATWDDSSIFLRTVNLRRVIGRRGFVLTLALTLSLSSVCIAMERKDGGDSMILGKQNTGKEIAVKAGDTIWIELEAIGGTGYWWYINDLDAAHLELLSEETRAISEEGKTGAPVMDIWRFRALKKGSAEIRLDYYRKWEGLESATEHFLIKLTID